MQALEDRFQALVEGSLAAAFVARDGDQVQQLTGMLLAISRAGTVEQLYISARLTPLQVCPAHQLGCALHVTCGQPLMRSAVICGATGRTANATHPVASQLSLCIGSLQRY